ncbi:nucleotidyl transferase AbiEii/AbiGii toxin family protein [Patescibacteria group bacterium]|nr:nucleotidyl transferase AbiEii/AbiGii toxin family protein [Patescibacteria group bacterium]
MSKSILSKNQKRFLQLFSDSKYLTSNFYLSGGTALCEYYIPYRYSEDLDFFSESEFELMQITAFIKSIKPKLGYRQLDINTSFNRNIFQIIFPNDILKVEFTYYPFPRIEEKKKAGKVEIDSILDIAVNKLFTIYQKPRSRDFMDLYMVCKKYDFQIGDLIKSAKIKFDWHVDAIKLGSQFLLVNKVKDYPKLINKIDHTKWQKFFKKEAKKLDTDIFRK